MTTRAFFLLIPSELSLLIRGTEKSPLFTAKELEKAVLSVKNKQAQEPDVIPSKVLNLKRQKVAKLLLIQRGKGDPGTP